MTLEEKKEDVLRRFSVNVSKGQCQRGISQAREMIEGNLEEHYTRVYDYADEIPRSNPGSTFKVGVDVNPGGINISRGSMYGSRFSRMDGKKDAEK